MEQRDGKSICIKGIFTCGFFYYYWIYQTGEEMKARGIDIPDWWMLCISPLNFLYMWKWAQGYEKLTNGALSAGMAFIYLCGLSVVAPILLQPKLNEVR